MPLAAFGQRVPFHPGPCTGIRRAEASEPGGKECRTGWVCGSWLLTQGLGNLGVQQG